jgi:hypothetical protein
MELCCHAVCQLKYEIGNKRLEFHMREDAKQFAATLLKPNVLYRSELPKNLTCGMYDNRNTLVHGLFEVGTVDIMKNFRTYRQYMTRHSLCLRIKLWRIVLLLDTWAHLPLP